VLLLLLAKESRSFVTPPTLLTASSRPREVPIGWIDPLNPSKQRSICNAVTTQAFLVHQHVPHGISPIVSSFVYCTIYLLATNLIYLFRRSSIRNMPKRKLLQIRITRDGVTVPLYITNLVAWQLFVNFVFPILEPMSRLFGYVSFYYFYPNASGLGVIFEPLSVQDQSMTKRAKHQIRLDWHRFSVNVGNIGRDGYRHPPSVERNLPHLDVPILGWKHWPWRRKYSI
jgi:hypothetical protein